METIVKNFILNLKKGVKMRDLEMSLPNLHPLKSADLELKESIVLFRILKFDNDLFVLFDDGWKDELLYFKFAERFFPEVLTQHTTLLEIESFVNENFGNHLPSRLNH